MSWLIPRNELTIEQIRAIELPYDENKVIFGAPGSGKTQILLYRARFLCDRIGSNSKFQIFVFTNVLKEYIKSALDLLDLRHDSVLTFDAWCLNFYKKNINSKLPWNDLERCPDFKKIKITVLDKIDSLKNKIFYDFVLIDEGQDLDSISYEILARISKHITVCIDHKQRIYEKGVTENEILSKLNVKKKNITLLDAFRCSPYVMELASLFLNNSEERQKLLNQTKAFLTEKETPLLYVAKDYEDELNKLIEILKTRLIKNERIAIILPQNKQVYGISKNLLNKGIEVETQDSYDFRNIKPKILTYHGVKGLTFDTVILPRLVNKSFSKFNGSLVNQLLFVAISRARKWVALITSEKNELINLNNVYRSLKEDKNILILKANSSFISQKNEVSISEDNDELLI